MSESLLLTRNVFLDTCAYDNQKLRFDHAALKKLKELGKMGSISILVTDTVDGEVRRHIRENLINASSALGRFQSHAGVLAADPPKEIKALFSPIDPSTLIESGLTVWDTFIVEAKVERLSAACVQGSELLEMYFSQRAPFSEKKKSEFPDAISLVSLAQWCQSKATQLYLVGDDPDLEAWCAERPGMYHIKSLKDFLDLYNRAEEKLTELVLAIFEREQKWIVSVIEESFTDCAFIYAENWEAEVENVETISIRIDDVDVIEVDERRFILTLDMKIDFRADVSGPDYDRGLWDSEDKRYASLPSFHTNVVSTESYEVSFEVLYDIENEEATEIRDVLFDDGKEIKVHGEGGWPYK